MIFGRNSAEKHKKDDYHIITFCGLVGLFITALLLLSPEDV